MLAVYNKDLTIQQFKPTFKEILLWLCKQRKRFIVSGHSMQPNFKEQDVVLVRPNLSMQDIKIGDVVVARHPQKNLLVIKYITQLNTLEHKVYLAGTQTQDHDAGWIPFHLVQGKVTARFV